MLEEILYLPIGSTDPTVVDDAPAAAVKINAAIDGVNTLNTTIPTLATATALGVTNSNVTALQTTVNTPTTGLSAVTATHTTQIATLQTQITGVVSAQQIVLSSYSGIDKTGVTNSYTAFTAILAAAKANVAAGTPTTIVVDCPVLVSISSTAANSIFWPAGVNITGTADGMIITDNLAAPFVFFCNVSNITWTNVHVRYVQPLSGAYMMNSNIASGWSGVAGSFQSQYLGGSSGYLAVNNGITYASGGSPIWQGPSALTALFNIRGNCTNIKFNSCTIDVPPNASPGGFIFTLANYCAEWTPNNVIIGYQSGGISASYNSGTGLVTVTKTNAFTNFTLGNQYWFYVSGFTPAAYNSSQILVTITTASTFTYPLATNPGTVTANGGFGSQSISGVTSAAPTNITWRDCYFDGLMMGHVQIAQLNLINCIWNRYTDLQHGTNNVVTFATAPTNGATTATLASLWPYPTTTYWVTLGNTQMLGMLLTLNSVTASTFIDPFTGAASSVVGQMVGTSSPLNGATTMTLTGWTLGVAIVNPITVTFTNPTNDVRSVTVTYSSGTYTANFTALTSACTSATQTINVGTAATCGVIGGIPFAGTNGYVFSVSGYSAPPHSVYMGSSSGAYPAYVIVKGCTDLGVRVWNYPYSRSMATSGNACSFKCELGRGSIIDGWTCYRSDGGMDLQSFSGTEGSTVSNCSVYFNSATSLIDYINNVPAPVPGSGAAAYGIPVFGVRMPGPYSYNNIVLHNINITDLNPSPTQIPFLGTNYAPNNNISVTGVKCFMGDFKTPGDGASAASPQPNPIMGGTNITLEAEMYYNSFSDLNTYVGQNSGGAPTQNANIYIKHFGYRTPAITLASTITNATSATISSATTVPQAPGCYPTGWPFPTAVYKVIFADNSVRYVTLTNGANTMTWTNQATVSANSSQLTGITAQGLYYQNFSSWKPRMLLDMTGGQTGSRYRVEDYSNQYFQDTIDNLVTETFGDSQAGVLVSGTSSFTTNLTIFGSMYLTALGVNSTTSITGTGLTGYTVGWSGSNAAIATISSLSANQSATFNPSSLATVANAAYGTNRTITITAVGGTFTSGTIQIAFKAQGSFMGS